MYLRCKASSLCVRFLMGTTRESLKVKFYRLNHKFFIMLAIYLKLVVTKILRLGGCNRFEDNDQILPEDTF